MLGGASLLIARRFKSELDAYCQASSSKLNLRKSKLYSWNINQREMFGIWHILGIEGAIIWDSFRYLKVPIFNNKPKTNPPIEKFKKKIHSSGMVSINAARKLVLIKVILKKFPSYQCSVLLGPSRILAKIEILLKSFLWKGGKTMEEINLLSLAGNKLNFLGWKEDFR